MNRLFTLSLALLLGVVVSTSTQAASVSKLLVGTFTSTNSDFLGTGVPTPFYMYLTFNDGGNFTAGSVITQSGVLLANVDTANAGWTIGNGGTDSLQVIAGTSVPGRFLNFTLTGPSSNVANTNQVVSNVEPFFGENGSVLPTLITFQNFIGQGYQGNITAVPEPTTMGLLAAGVFGAGVWHRRRSKKNAA